MIRFLHNMVFLFLIYGWMLVVGGFGTLYAITSREATYRVINVYCKGCFLITRYVAGIRVEVRGTPPTGDVLVAAKHQSFLDVLMIFNAVPRGKFIMKREILFMPIIGFYAKRIGSAPVNRGKKGDAIRKMVADVKKGNSHPGQLIIYPQGTRVAVDSKLPYKIGAGVLYDRTGKDCVPVAANVGVFWSRYGLTGKRGTAIIEFLPKIPTGKPMREFMQELEETVETASIKLMAEAGYVVPE